MRTGSARQISKIALKGGAAVGLALFVLGCGGSPAPAPAAATPPVVTAPDKTEEALGAVASVHGEAGPWAVAGYRMGNHALAKLGLKRQSFDLEVVHHSPRAVMLSCIADGAEASTGASVGKLNLSFVEASRPELATVYRKKSTGESITLRPTPAFAARFSDFPRSDARKLGREVLLLPDSDVFEEVPPSAH